MSISHKKLLGNSVAAMMAAIEIYNKPKFEYREECFVILLINAWELALKACLSKYETSIFYPQKKNLPLRTFNLDDAFKKSKKYWPKEIDFNATQQNIEFLADFRDNAIHFYNDESINVILYSLSQTAIVNYKDFLKTIFNKDLTKEITISLLPLALSAPIDPIALLNKQPSKSSKNVLVRNYCNKLKLVINNLEKHNHDTGRLLTIFNVKLESVKKATTADFIVNVDTNSKQQSFVIKKVDPNISHPLLMKDIVYFKHSKGENIKFGKVPLTPYVFQAIVAHFEIRKKPEYYWADNSGSIKRYSNEFVTLLKNLNTNQVEAAIEYYKKWQKERRIEKTQKNKS